VSTTSFTINLYKLIQEWGSIRNIGTRSSADVKRRLANSLKQLDSHIYTKLEQTKEEIAILNKGKLIQNIDNIQKLMNHLQLYKVLVAEMIKDIERLSGGRLKQTRKKSHSLRRKNTYKKCR